jgi:hypothetical protein
VLRTPHHHPQTWLQQKILFLCRINVKGVQHFSFNLQKHLFSLIPAFIRLSSRISFFRQATAIKEDNSSCSFDTAQVFLV